MSNLAFSALSLSPFYFDCVLLYFEMELLKAIRKEKCDPERVDCYKYLGVTLNQRLSSEDHVSNIASKIRKRISILSRIKYMLPISVRLTFYNTMIKPIFEYNSVAGGDKRNTVHMDTLQILQNRAAKIIFGRELRDSATQALKDLNWVTLVKKRTTDRWIFVYKCLNNLIGFDFGFKSFKNRHDCYTRNKQNLAFELSKTNWGFFKTVPHCGKDWNTIDLETRNADNLIAFKKSIVKIFC